MTLICTCTVPLSWLLSRLDDVEISDDILKDQTLASVFKILYFSFVVWSSPGGRCQRQLLTNVKALENMNPGLFDRWKFIPVEFFCKGSSIDCLLTRPSTGKSTCWSSFSAGEKLFFPLHSGILAGCETWEHTPWQVSKLPLTPSMVHFPILRNSASFLGRHRQVLDGFLCWQWCTQAYPDMSCFCSKTFCYLISLSTSLEQHCRDFHEQLGETSLITHILTCKPQKEVSVVGIWPNNFLELLSKTE